MLLRMCFGAVLALLELNHLDRYGHLVGFGLHADLVVAVNRMSLLNL